MKVRLQKVLARAGYSSRRGCEEIIANGRVHVNGDVASLGDKADPELDEITVDGTPIPEAEQLKYIALYKPIDVLSTVKTPGNRTTVRDLVQIPGRLYPVGRLDYDSEGLMLMTNDGRLTNRLTHPRYQHEKEYRLLVNERVEQSTLQRWRSGITLEDDSSTLPAEVWIESRGPAGTWLGVILKEGKNRQLRRMAAAENLTIQRLIRVRMASLHLGELQPGEWRRLTEPEIRKIKQS